VGLEQVVIVLAADAAFCRQLAVVIAGISRTAHVPHKIFALHDGYDEQLRTRIGESAGENLEIIWLDARSAILDSAILSHYPPSSLYRLRLGTLLPADVHRVIYLDSDVVVRDSLVELWRYNLGDTLVGAVRDPLLPWAASPDCLDWQTFGLAPDMPYFNAGVLVIPLDIWRSCDVGGLALSLLQQHAFPRADQCALNVVAAGKWTPLHPRWNLQAGHLEPQQSYAWLAARPDELREATERPAIVHFNTAVWRRPWQPGSVYPNRELWFEDLDRTAWLGWRPDEPRRSVIRRVANRVTRAGRVLLRGK
jgi:lipopolysaccharide biosynthesis glycosyltransferase